MMVGGEPPHIGINLINLALESFEILYVNCPDISWLVVSNMTFIFHFIYGMSSFPLTFTFFKVVIAPPTSITIKPIMNDSTQGSEFRSITGFKFHLRS